MPDPVDPGRRAALPTSTSTSPGADPDAARRSSAAARIGTLDQLELCLLELAVQATDDRVARWLEAWADTAWRDAVALRAEHGAGGAWEDE